MKIIYNYKLIYNFLVLCLLAFSFEACEDKLSDEHYNQSDEALNKNLITLLSEDSDLSTFYGYVKDTGYDELLAQSQSFTVWAPTNDALSSLSADISNDPDVLYQFIGNHISRYSYTTSDLSEEGLLMKMFNDKYVKSTYSGGTVYFDDAEVIESDILSNNGILHKTSSAVSVKSNIWGYYKESVEYPTYVDYATLFESTDFDPSISTIIGKNSLGKTVYDSVYVTNSSYFDLVGNLDSEEERFSCLGLTESVYTDAFETYKQYFKHPVEDTTLTNVNKTLFNNIVFPEMDANELDKMVPNTLGNGVVVNSSSIDEIVKLSNGNILVANDFDFSPSDLIYKPIRYEAEDNTRRSAGDDYAMTFTKKYDKTASDLFYTKVVLSETPNENESNSYFEVEFSNVLSADYDIYLKFVPVSVTQDTKLKFEFNCLDSDQNVVSHSIESVVVSSQENGLVKIGDTYTNSIYVNDDSTNDYKVSLKIYVDVSDPEMVLYTRIFGIDYIELVPAE